jgi:D-alanine-D-alanine ligase
MYGNIFRIFSGGLMGKLRIALISGGWSQEREVSLKSGDAVYSALDKDKYEIRRYDPRDDLIGLIQDSAQIDLVMLFLHGKKGEDGSMQGLLDLLNLPYVGSRILASALAMNKALSKEFFRNAGLRVPREMIISQGDNVNLHELFSALGRPAVIKPIAEGSSIGLRICGTEQEAAEAIADTHAMGEGVLAEEYVRGVEVTCPVLGNRNPEALPVIEIIPREEHQFFDYTAKYVPGASQEICPARLPVDVYGRVQEYAILAHRVLGCRHLSRTDMIVAGGDVYVLETNTIPGMTENSLFPLAARTAGISLSGLMDRLIELALAD